MSKKEQPAVPLAVTVNEDFELLKESLAQAIRGEVRRVVVTLNEDGTISREEEAECGEGIDFSKAIKNPFK